MQFPWVAEMGYNLDGNLIPRVRDREQFFTWLKRTFKEGERVWIKVSRPSKERTHEQFKYLYSCVYTPIAEHIYGVVNNSTLNEIDGIMKYRLLKVNEDTPLEYVKNKTDLNRKELSEYVDACRAEAANMGIETQDPLEK
jgi:hypothetical protein